MAVTKTHPIKRALKAAIDYICNPEKTDAGDGDDDRFREAADHVEDAAVPAGRRHAHLAGDLTHLRIHGVKGPGEVGDDAVDQQLLEPLLDHFNYHGWSHLLSGAPAVKREPPGGWSCRRSGG